MARSKAARKAAWHRNVFLVGVLGAIAVMAYTVWRRRSGEGGPLFGGLPWEFGDGGAAVGSAGGSGRVPLSPINRPPADRPITQREGWEETGIFGPKQPKSPAPTEPAPDIGVTSTGGATSDPLLGPAVPTRRR